MEDRMEFDEQEIEEFLEGFRAAVDGTCIWVS